MSCEVLYRLHSSGFTVWVEGGRLLCAPASKLTPELRQAIQEHKPDLMRLLSETTNTFREGPPYPDGRGLVKCFYCEQLTKGVCQISSELMSGIALLRDCEYFVMQSVH